MTTARVAERETEAIRVGVAAKIIGLPARKVRLLIEIGTLAGRKLNGHYYTTRRAARAISHSLQTNAPFHVAALATP
jgi:hypothetical protein